MKKELKVNMDHEVLSMASAVTYRTVNDWYDATVTDLKMNLIIPKIRQGHPRQPCILWICGGAFSVVNRDAWMPELMAYARAGYTVASIDYRTSNKAPFPAALEDAKAAVRFLKAHADLFCLDPGRIVAMGESAGGTIASLLGTTGSERKYDVGDYLDYDSTVAAVVDYYGLSDLYTQKLSASENVPSFLMQAFTGPDPDRSNAKEASPLYHISEQTPPVLIIHGKCDHVVDPLQSELFYEALQKAGIRSELIMIEEADHGADIFYQKEVQDIILQFLKEVL